MENTNTRQIIVILNNVRSSENVGSIFRTADAAGVSKIILCGYTPAPIDRFGRENKGLTKASLGAEKFVEWEKIENFSEAVSKLRNHFFRSQMLRISRFKNDSSAWKIVAIEQSKDSVDYRNLKTSKLLASSSKLAIVFGNEVEGLSKEDLELCDAVAEIPMRGAMVRQAHHPHNTNVGKESLNVAVCAGIVLYSLI